MGRLPLIAGNWKMHKNKSELHEFAQALKNTDVMNASSVGKADVWIAMPVTLMEPGREQFESFGIEVGSQNVHFAEAGAFTGELSIDMVREAGAQFTLVGHSERRQLFGDTDEAVKQKVAACQGAGFVSIACLGETLEERESNETISVCDRQLAAILNAVTKPELLVVAYEPVWAIGTGKTASADQAQEVHAHLRQRLVENFGGETGNQIRILYGGSVKPANVHSLLAQDDIDGALVGGASLAAEDFSALILAGYEAAS